MISSDALDELGLVALPEEVRALCSSFGAPPRLVAHLTLVHDVAGQIARAVRKQWPRLVVDADAVCFGAAIHDIGKAEHVAELSAPGTLHEERGRELLLSVGVTPERARFAVTHGQWARMEVTLEDLLVVLADVSWKGKRNADLEDRIVRMIAQQARQEAWRIFDRLDGIVAKIAARADERLAWQGRYSAQKEQE